MTGAGSGTLLIAQEDSFLGSLEDADSDGTPDLYEMGRDPTITNFEHDNDLSHLRDADSVWSVESLKENFTGSITIEAVVSADTFGPAVEDIVFNDGGTAIKRGLSNSATIFTGVKYPSGDSDRVLSGCIPVELSINYEQGENVTFSIQYLFAEAKPSTSVDLTTATEVTDGTSVPFHGFDLTLDSGNISTQDLQSCTLTLSNLANYHRGNDPTPNRGVVDEPTATLDLEAIFTSPSRLEFARGNSTGTLPDTVDSVPGTISMTASGGTAVSTYNLSAVAPGTYSWANVVSPDDTTDQLSCRVNEGVTVS